MLKSVIKRSFHRMGFDLQRINPIHSSEVRLAITLKKHRVNLIFDIGANCGQFAQSVRDAGYAGRIVSFEPLSVAWEQLSEASKADPLWDIAPRAAIGSEDSEIMMHIAGNLASSSALEMLGTHVNAAPESAYVDSEIVPVRRLDTIAASYLDSDSNLFIKIDTQGFEGQVLGGAPEILQKAVGLNIELLLVPLYENQCKYDELFNKMKTLGFNLWDISPVFVDPQNGRTLAVDATFYRD